MSLGCVLVQLVLALPPADAFYATRRVLPTPGPLSVEAASLVARGRISFAEERLGVPTFFWAGRAPQDSVTPRGLGMSPVEAARSYLATYAELYRCSARELAAARVRHVHDVGEGAIVVGFGASVGGVPVFRDELRVVLDRQLRLVALAGYLAPQSFRTPPLGWALPATSALRVALGDALGQVDAGAWSSLGVREGGYETWAGPAPARTRAVAFTLADRMEPAWYVELDLDGGAPRAVAYVVSARDGRLLFRHELTRDEAYAYRVFADPGGVHLPYHGPQGFAGAPHPTGVPDGYQATPVAPVLVTLEHGPTSRPDPWLAPGATELSGNNAEAYADRASPDGFGAGDLRGQRSAPGAFDYTYDLGAAPDVSAGQVQASLAEQFYAVNFLHDWYYDVGFDEAAGNAQTDNFGRGGLPGDSLKCEAQDYSGRNNANMTTPADGARPRLQTFIFDGSTDQTVRVTAPASLARDVPANLAEFGPATFSLAETLVAVDDGTAPAADGCETPFVNAAALSGHVALLDRGLCTFTQKVANAQAAGAVGAVVVNNTAGPAPVLYGFASSITIPVLSVSQADGAVLRSQLGGGLSVTLVRQPTVDRDSALDNAVVAHEWGHLLTNRLVGDANGLVGLQADALSEGYSDFLALLMQARAEDAAVPANADWMGVWAMAAWVHSGGHNNGYYFSLRRYPYSADPQKNPLTFRHVGDGEALPSGPPINGNSQPNSEVHNAGEVWAQMLWQCYTALLRGSGRPFSEVQTRMRRDLVAGLKATPNAPTFLEARDALLAAMVADDPADHRLCAQAFASRGAGVLAVGPPRDSPNNLPVREDYTVGNAAEVPKVELLDDVSTCDADGVLDPGEVGTLAVTVRNVGMGTLSATRLTVRSLSAAVSLVDGDTAAVPALLPFASVVVPVRVAMESGASASVVDFDVSVDDLSFAVPGAVVRRASFRANADVLADGSRADDVEVPATAWTVSHDPAMASFDWRRVDDGAGHHAWLGVDPPKRADLYLVSPPLQVATGEDWTFGFKHRHDFEASSTTRYDGAVLELSADDQQTWVDLGPQASPGYGGTVNSGGSNPLKGRPAYVARSANYPSWVQVRVALGQTYAGQTVRVRFRVAGDDAAGAAGWELDDFDFAGLANAPFSRFGPEDGVCVERRPVARADGPEAVGPDDAVVLDGSRSFDPDGEPLGFTWAQVDGPPVSLQGADGPSPRFRAPRTNDGGSLVFTLVVNDGHGDSVPARLALRLWPDADVYAGCRCTAGSAGWGLGALGWALARRARRRGQAGRDGA